MNRWGGVNKYRDQRLHVLFVRVHTYHSKRRIPSDQRSESTYSHYVIEKDSQGPEDMKVHVLTNHNAIKQDSQGPEDMKERVLTMS